MINPWPGHSVDFTVSHSLGLHTHLRASAVAKQQLIKYTIVAAQLISRTAILTLLLLLSPPFIRGPTLVRELPFIIIRCIINPPVILLLLLLLSSIIAVIYCDGPSLLIVPFTGLPLLLFLFCCVEWSRENGERWNAHSNIYNTGIIIQQVRMVHRLLLLIPLICWSCWCLCFCFCCCLC